MHAVVWISFISSVAAAFAVTPASAQPRFDRIVAFGDSYADIGNVRSAVQEAGLGALYPEAEYPTGRFSGGTNFVDTIAAAYGVGQDNYAIGGAQAGTGNVAGQRLLPGFRQQWVAFTQGGSTYTDLAITVPIYVSGVRTVIPNGGLAFAPDDLVVFSVGGNDARPYRRNGTLEGAPAAADAAAAQATAGLDALTQRGIKHLVFTAGDVGRLAEAVGKPNAPVGTAFSIEYNARMQTTLSRLAGVGVQVAYVDITQIANVVNRDLARFGFIDTTSACPAACIGNAALQTRYFFYDDGIHLTSEAFELVGAYSVNQINAPYSIRATDDLPRLSAAGFARAIDGRLSLARTHKTTQGMSLFGSFQHQDARRHADRTSNGYRWASRGALGGIEYVYGPATVGLLASYGSSDANGQADDRVRGRSYQVGGYAIAERGHLFGQAYGGYGWHDLHIRRTGVADSLRAAPDAKTWVTGGRVGWLIPAGSIRIGPTLSLDYAHVRIDGYREADDPAASLAVRRQTYDELSGSAGLEARFMKAADFMPWLRLAAEKSLDGNARTVRYAPTAAPGIVNAFKIEDSTQDLFGSVAGGLSAVIAGPLSLELSGHANFSRDTVNQASILAAFRLEL